MSSHQSNFKNSINYLIGLIILTLCVAYYSEHNWVQGNHNQEAVNEQSMATILAKLKTEPQSDKLINLFTYQNEYINK